MVPPSPLDGGTSLSIRHKLSNHIMTVAVLVVRVKLYSDWPFNLNLRHKNKYNITGITYGITISGIISTYL